MQLLPDIAILHVRELYPHPHLSLGARTNPHPPTGYTSLVSLKSVRGEGVVLYLVGAVGEMQGDSRNGRTFRLDLESGGVSHHNAMAVVGGVPAI